ncbi:uncharacterized protein LOC120126128 [Hibiscus syriacus]|uniref:uncharacterized protein LOC120126128 n=1 Tax=Hibiscus syriacus TaxID=106335 RepID=UPI0019241B59|nr:uncharacterized protein LOC120126128 [Hibiscus syriacus]
MNEFPLVEFAYNNSFQLSIQMASCKALYGHNCRTPLCWIQLSEDRQRSYADLKHKDIKFIVGDKVFIKVSSWKKMFLLGCKGKLTPHFIGPYELIEIIGPLAYRLALPPELESINNVFNVSMLRRYRSNPSHAIPLEKIEVSSDITYSEEPFRIVASKVKELRNKKIHLVKVLWGNYGFEKAMWKTEKDVKL